MKRILLFGLATSLSLSLLGCTIEAGKGKEKVDVHNQIEQQIDEDKLNNERITSLIEDFGSRLQRVSLLSPIDVLEKSMKESYGDFVSQTLLEKWIKDPENAPGRRTSSPWPDRIEIQSIEKLSEEEYEIKGNIIEITSSKEDKAIHIPIKLNVKKIEDKWVIDDVILAE